MNIGLAFMLVFVTYVAQGDHPTTCVNEPGMRYVAGCYNIKRKPGLRSIRMNTTYYFRNRRSKVYKLPADENQIQILGIKNFRKRTVRIGPIACGDDCKTLKLKNRASLPTGFIDIRGRYVKFQTNTRKLEVRFKC